ncbi:MAG: hypothetical protein ACO3A4_13885 [Silvanigrellaceae bacterium]
MYGVDLKMSERWRSATAAALSSLSENFPINSSVRDVAGGVWGFLTPDRFPCQKPDTGPVCPGWALIADPGFATPGIARPCPCLMGRKMRLGGVLELAHEFQVTSAMAPDSGTVRLSPYLEVKSSGDFLNALLAWMWLAAAKSFSPGQPGSWVDEVDPACLSPLQRKSMRWWARLVELSSLAENQGFAIVMRSSIEFLCKDAHLEALSDYLDRLQSGDEKLLVLALNGSPLAPTGIHSPKNDWLEMFLSLVDDRCLGLCIVSQQPLVSTTSDGSLRTKGEYRWKAKHQVDGVRFSVQEVLKRGSWDRLCEALARGEHHLGRLMSV